MKSILNPFRVRAAVAFTLAVLITALPAAADSPRVKLLRTPQDGIQPQAVVDHRGVVHLIYYKGEGGGGDVFYVRQEPGQETFSKPIPAFPKGRGNQKEQFLQLLLAVLQSFL